MAGGAAGVAAGGDGAAAAGETELLLVAGLRLGPVLAEGAWLPIGADALATAVAVLDGAASGSTTGGAAAATGGAVTAADASAPVAALSVLAPMNQKAAPTAPAPVSKPKATSDPLPAGLFAVRVNGSAVLWAGAPVAAACSIGCDVDSVAGAGTNMLSVTFVPLGKSCRIASRISAAD